MRCLRALGKTYPPPSLRWSGFPLWHQSANRAILCRRTVEGMRRMQKIGKLAGGIALAVWAGAGLADDRISVAGRQIEVVRIEDGMSGAGLVVDGAMLLKDGVVYLDPEPLVIGGVTVVTGAAGAGGNACNAAPFVLALPQGGAPELSGPVDSCAYLLPQIDGDELVFGSESTPDNPGEIWVWTREAGFAPGPAPGFVASAGWEALDGLSGAHPADAMKLAPVLEALQAGLGADYPVFAERISDLGSGDLTADGYLGEACLKFTCDEDWAALYLHRDTRQIFAIWHVGGESETHVWPKDTAVWPVAAVMALQDRMGG
jgi:hypothetical protein